MYKATTDISMGWNIPTEMKQGPRVVLDGTELGSGLSHWAHPWRRDQETIHIPLSLLHPNNVEESCQLTELRRPQAHDDMATQWD